MLTFEVFKRAIDQIEANEAHDDKITEALGVEGFTTIFHPTNETLVAVLVDAMQDEDTWIEYYLWELNFGKNYKPGVSSIDGIEVPLRTVEDLYAILTRRK